MVVQSLLSAGYILVENSWIVAAAITKYYLLGIAVETFLGERSWSALRENLVLYRKEFITAIVLLGGLKALLGLEFEPVLKLYSELVALIYLAYLFWKY